ncbi:acyl-CoA-like ligand-binding transcription factor [Micromonospora auratinigra]|uniref:Transcriptional regulator, TetR family n=1 Tax=Micromonospora auratinigra TaxID=261654 RepID=A0A1A8ZDB8_9ACTN|nr:TetR family transcriptional regulator [Micromonospora auratinigra]SBT41849.1 transcriptional regulator, TetR family [Micromonospora auratinigra]
MAEIGGLRERKKAATRLALHEAALRLATEHGPERVTVEAIADAAEVSRRTFSNYFSSKEEALFHGDTVRLRGMLDLLRDRPADEPPWTALRRAALHLSADVYDDAALAWLTRRRQLHGHPGLVAHQVAAYIAIERELAGELARRLGGPDDALRARLLAATFLATLRVAVQHWLEHPDGPLADTLATALDLAAPAGQTPRPEASAAR